MDSAVIEVCVKECMARVCGGSGEWVSTGPRTQGDGSFPDTGIGCYIIEPLNCPSLDCEGLVLTETYRECSPFKQRIAELGALELINKLRKRLEEEEVRKERQAQWQMQKAA